MQIIKALMIGDVVGEPGLETLEFKLPSLIKEQNIDFTIVNGENAAEGFGITDTEFDRIIAAGADVVTSGNHVWEKRHFMDFLDNEKRMLRPANYNPVPAAGAPYTTRVSGSGFYYAEKNGINWAVINLQGREYMSPIDCPFRYFDNIKEQLKNAEPPCIVLVDFHAESSREKEALAFYADGRASLIAGTHTHVQTADERILPRGCAYITDLGMTGITNSVLGMDPKICLDRFINQVQYQMKTAASDGRGKLQGVIAEIDADTGKAVSVVRVSI